MLQAPWLYYISFHDFSSDCSLSLMKWKPLGAWSPHVIRLGASIPSYVHVCMSSMALNWIDMNSRFSCRMGSRTIGWVQIELDHFSIQYPLGLVTLETWGAWGLQATRLHAFIYQSQKKKTYIYLFFNLHIDIHTYMDVCMDVLAKSKKTQSIAPHLPLSPTHWMYRRPRAGDSKVSSPKIF